MHNLSRFTVKWFLCNDSPYSSTIIANLSTDKPWVSHSRYCVRHNSTLKAFILTIIDVQVSDNGIYCCEVIRLAPPPILTGKGNGTLLNVTGNYFFNSLKSVLAVLLGTLMQTFAAINFVQLCQLYERCVRYDHRTAVS